MTREDFLNITMPDKIYHRCNSCSQYHYEYIPDRRTLRDFLEEYLEYDLLEWEKDPVVQYLSFSEINATDYEFLVALRKIWRMLPDGKTTTD